MNCKECPYIKDEFNERMSYCDEYFPNYYSEKDIEECCYCIKTDGRLCWTSTCDKFPSEKIRRVCNRNPKKRRSTKRERDKKYKERMKYLYDALGHLVSSPVDKYGYYTKDLKLLIIKDIGLLEQERNIIKGNQIKQLEEVKIYL